MFIVSVVCCQIEVSAMGRSLCVCVMGCEQVRRQPCTRTVSRKKRGQINKGRKEGRKEERKKE